jgi:predicted dithiol-disulfide oxidoreductase (DUF899 family)
MQDLNPAGRLLVAVADHFGAARKHFDDADLSFAMISRAPIERIESPRQRRPTRCGGCGQGAL